MKLELLWPEVPVLFLQVQVMEVMALTTFLTLDLPTPPSPPAKA
jgi:hypothetical protein